MDSIQTKDYILLFVGFLLSIPAGLIVIWLVNVFSRFSKVGSKYIRLGRYRAEQNRFLRILSLRHSEYSTAYTVTECSYAVASFLSGLMIIGMATACLFIDLIFTHPSGDLNFAKLSAFFTIFMGIVGCVTGFLKYRRMLGDLSRLTEFDICKLSFEKQQNEFLQQNNKTM